MENAINNILYVPPEEEKFCELVDSSGKKVLVRPDQKSVEWMMDLVFKFCNAGDLALDTCAGTSASVKPCLQLLEYCRPVECEKVLLVLKTRFTASRIIHKAAFEFGPRHHLERRGGRNKECIFKWNRSTRVKMKDFFSWTVPFGLDPVQKVPAHTTHFASNMDKDGTLLKKYLHINLSQWSEKWCGHYSSIGENMHFAFDGSAQRIMLKRSTILYVEAELGLFSSRILRKVK